MTYVDAASGDEMASPRQQQQPRDLPSPIAIEGTMMAMPTGASPVDMSVVPEPVPRIDAMDPPSLPAYGGTAVLRIVGQHFGTAGDLDQTVAIGGQACKQTKWVSAVALDCVGPPAHAVHTRAPVQVIVAGSRSDPGADGAFVNYEPPVVQRLVPAVGPTHGGTRLRVLGRNFGDFNVAGASSPLVFIGDLPCTSPRLINSTEIQCITVRRDGGAGPMLVHVEVDGLRSNDTVPSESATPEAAAEAGSQNIYSYELPTVHLIEPDAGPTFGGIRVTVYGTGFGRRDEVLVQRSITIGGQACEGVKVVSDRELSCKLPILPVGSAAGKEGKNVDVIVMVDAKKAVAASTLETSTPKEMTFRYVDMSIGSVLPADPYVLEGFELVLIGNELAPWDVRPHFCARKSDLQQCRPDTVNAVGHSEGGALVGGSDSAKKRPEDDCKLVERTHSGPCSREDPLCNGGGRYTCSCVHPTYPTDEKSRVLSRPLCKVDAKKVPTIVFRSDEDNEDENGDGEGDNQPTYTCPRVSVDHPTQLRCHLPKENGLGGPTNVTVIRRGGNGGEATMVFTLLDRPVITEIAMPREFGGPLTLRGHHFGTKENAMTVRVGPKHCLDVTRTFANKEGELDTLTCQVEAGEIAAGGDDGLDVRIFAKDIPPADPRQGVRAEMRAEIHLPDPIITDVVPPIIASFGLTNITISGEHVANMLFPSRVLVGGLKCTKVQKISHKKIICSAPAMAQPGPTLPHKVAVEVKVRRVNGTLPNGVTYGQAKITSITPRRIASVGGEAVRVRGYLLGDKTFPWAPLIKIGATACAAAQRSDDNPDSEFVCTSARAQPGEKLAVSVEVAPGVLVSAPIGKVIPPQLTALSPTEGPSYGEDMLTISGSGFGSDARIVVARVDGVACVKTTLVSDTEVKCLTPKRSADKETNAENNNARVPVTVEVAGVESEAVSTAAALLTQYLYVPVSPARVEPAFGPSYGGEVFTIFGRFLGLAKSAQNAYKDHLVPEVFVGPVPCAQSTLQAGGESITCVPAPGSGNQSVTVIVNGVRSAVSSAVSYEYRAPTVHTISPRSGPSYGGIVVDVRGSDLGTKKDLPTLHFGTDAVCANVEIVVPHRHIRCLALPETVTPGKTNLVVSVRGQAGPDDTKQSEFEYNAPKILRIEPNTGPTYGDWPLTIHGAFLGRPKGPDASLAVEDDDSDDEDDAKPAAAVMAEARFLQNRRSGLNAASTHALPRVMVGGLECRDVDLVDDHTIRCLAPPGVPGKVNVEVVVSGVRSKVSTITMEGPAVDLVSPSSGPTYGGNRVSVSGRSLADMNNKNVDAVVSIGGVPCEDVAAISEHQLECTVGAVSEIGPAEVEVTVLGVKQKMGTYTFRGPIVSRIIPSFGAARGGAPVILVGENLQGTSAMRPTVIFGSASSGGNEGECTTIQTPSSHTLKCVTPDNMLARAEDIDVRIGDLSSLELAQQDRNLNVTMFDFVAPEIDMISPESVPNYGLNAIVLHGRFFGLVDANTTDKARAMVEKKLSVAIGGVPCASIRVVSDTNVKCMVPARSTLSLDTDQNIPRSSVVPVVASFNKAASNANVTVRYKPPQIRTVVPTHHARDAPHRITVEGRFLGLNPVATTVMVGDSECIDLERVSQHIVTCSVQPGPTGAYDVSVIVGDDTAVKRNAYRRDNATIVFDSIEPSHAPFWKLTRLKIDVETLGISPTTYLKVEVGGVDCTNVSHTLKDSDVFDLAELDNNLHTVSNKRTIECDLPAFSSKDTPLGPVPVVVALRDGFGDVETNTTRTLLTWGQPRFAVEPEHAPSYGRRVLTLNYLDGDNPLLGDAVTEVFVGPDRRPCKNVKTNEDIKSLQCMLPCSSLAGKNQIYLKRGEYTATIGPFFYKAPEVHSVSPRVGTTLGHEVLTIKGKYFGDDGVNDAVQVTIDGIPCEDVKRASSELLTCRTGAHLLSTGTYEVLVSVHAATGRSPHSPLAKAFDGKSGKCRVQSDDEPGYYDGRGRSTTGNATKFEYDGPIARGISPNHGAPFGGDIINISGARFGPKEQAGEIMAFVGGKPCQLSTWITPFFLECVTPPGFGSNLDVTVSIGGTTFDIPEKFSYITPIVTSVTPPHGAAWKSTYIVLRGEGLVPSDFELGVEKPESKKMTVMIGNSRCANAKVRRNFNHPGDDVITCTAEPVAIGQSYAVIVSDGVKFSDSKGAKFTYEDPLITEKPKPQPFYGGVRQVFKGRNFGNAHGRRPDNFTIMLGDSECPEVEWTSDNEVSCVPGAAASTADGLGPSGDGVPVTIIVDDWDSLMTKTSTLDFSEPKVMTVEPNIVPTYGGQRITVRGWFLGTKEMVKAGRVGITVDGEACTGVKMLDDASQFSIVLECTVPQAQSDTVPAHSSVTVTIDGGHGGTYALGLHYQGPIVHSIMPTFVPAFGYKDILIRGDYFGKGAPEDELLASINGTLCLKTTWLSIHTVRCHVPPGHTGHPANVIVSVKGHTSTDNVDNGLLEYTGPRVLSVAPIQGPAFGGTRVTLRGSGLASLTTPHPAMPFVRIGQAPCSDLKVVSESEVTCTTGSSFDVDWQEVHLKLWTGFGYAQSHSVHTLAANETSAALIKNGSTHPGSQFYYNGPLITSVAPLDGAAYGGDILTLRGHNFGPKNLSEPRAYTEVKIGTQMCTDVELISPQEIQCRTPAGAKRDQQVTLKVGENVAHRTKNFTFHYRLPFVQCVEPHAVTSGGGTRVRLLGRDLGSDVLEPLAYIGGQPCTDLKLVNENHIECTAPPLNASANTTSGEDVIVTVLDDSEPTEGVHHAPHFLFSGIGNALINVYAPVVEVLDNTEGPSFGNRFVEITGEHLGHGKDRSKPVAYIGDTPCLETIVTTNYTLICKTPLAKESAGTGPQMVSVQLGPSRSAVFPNGANYTFLPPVVAEVRGASHGPMYGGTVLTLLGERLGLPDGVATPKVWVGEAPCGDITVIDEYTVTCVTTEGTGADLPVRLTNGMVAVVKTEYRFTYQTSIVKRVVPDHVQWFGNEWIVIEGRHLGSQKFAPVVSVGGKPCLETRFMGPVLQCLTPSTPALRIGTVPRQPGVFAEIVVSIGNVTTKGHVDPVNGTVLSSSAGSKVRYIAPEIDSIAAGKFADAATGMPIVPTYGGSWISIKGRHLAPRGCSDKHKAMCASLPALRIMIGEKLCNTTIVEASSSIEPALLCRVGPRARPGNVNVSVETTVKNGKLRSRPVLVKYGAPRVTSVLPTFGAFNDRTLITVHGRFFGEERAGSSSASGKDGKMTTRVTVGGLPCTNVHRISPEVLTCRTPRSAAGSEPRAQIRVSVEAEFTTKSSSQKRVLFTRTPADSAKEDADASTTDFIFAPPTVARVTPELGPAFGYQIVSIFGANFGNHSDPNATENVVALIAGHPCLKTERVSKNHLKCLTPPMTIDDYARSRHLVRIPVSVDVIIDGTHSTAHELSDVAFYYKRPKIIKFTPTRGPAYGGTKVRILGKLLGSPVVPGDLRDTHIITNVRIGRFECENLTVIDQFEARCVTAPARHAGYPLDLRVNGVPAIVNNSNPLDERLRDSSVATLNSSDHTFSVYTYLPMEVLSLVPSVVPSYGGSRLHIRGKWLGASADAHPVAFIGDKACAHTEWKSETHVVCVTPHFFPLGPSENVQVKVTVGTTSSVFVPDVTPLLRVVNPVVTSISKKEGGAAGGENVTVFGDYFGHESGPSFENVVVLMAGVPCQETQRISNRRDALTCITPAKFTGDLDAIVAVSIDGHNSVGAAPEIEDDELELSDNSTTTNTTAIVRREQRNSEKKAPTYHYKVIKVLGVDVTNGPASGGYLMTITGDSFGKTSEAFIGDRPCAETRVVGFDRRTIECVVPAGLGAGHTVEVRVRKNISSLNAIGQNGVMRVVFNYDAPVITELHAQIGPKMGGARVNISGLNFGPVTEMRPPAVNFGEDNLCLDIERLSDSLITCVTPPGIGTETVTVTVANQSSTPVENEGEEDASLSATTYMYRPAQIEAYSPISGPTEGGWLLTIIGVGFGPNATELMAANASQVLELDAEKRAELKADQLELLTTQRSKNASSQEEAREEELEGDAQETFEKNALNARKAERNADESAERLAKKLIAEEAKEEARQDQEAENDEIVESRASDARNKDLEAAGAATLAKAEDAKKSLTASVEADKQKMAQVEQSLEVESANEEAKEAQEEDTALKAEEAETNEAKAEEFRFKQRQRLHRERNQVSHKSQQHKAHLHRHYKQHHGGGAHHSRFTVVPKINDNGGAEFQKADARGFKATARVIGHSVQQQHQHEASHFITENSRGGSSTAFVEESEHLLLGNKAARRLRAAHRLSRWVHNANPYASFSPSRQIHNDEHRFRASMTALMRKKQPFKAGVWVSGRPCVNVTWVSDSRVTCIVPAGVGHHLTVKVVSPVDGGVAAQVKSTKLSAPALSYDAPTVGSVNIPVGKAGDLLTIKGKDFAMSNATGKLVKPVAFIGRHACDRTEFMSTTELRCVVPHGAGKKVDVSVSVAQQTGPGAALFSYPPPIVKRNMPQGGNGTGGNIVRVRGSNFGEAKFVGNVTEAFIGKRKCHTTTIVSDTLIECVAPPGVGEHLDVTVVAGGQRNVNPWTKCMLARRNSTSRGTNHTAGNMTTSNGTEMSAAAAPVPSCVPVPATVSYSYPSPAISNIVPDSVKSKGGSTVMIHGKNFGASGEDVEVSIGGKPCTGVKIVSPSLIACQAPPGKGDMIPVTILTGGQSSDIYDRLEYDGPRIYMSSPKRARNKTDEATNITMHGINLGLPEHGNRAKLTVGGYPCVAPIVRHSNKSWTCKIEEDGRMGISAPVQIHLPGRHRPSPPNGSAAGFTFKAMPELAEVTPPYGPSKGLGVVLTLRGKFGPSKPALFSIKIGENDCLNNGGEWVSPTEASCVLPSGTGHNAIHLSINNAPAQTPTDFPPGSGVTFDYDPPILRSVFPKAGPGQGGNVIHLFGRFEVNSDGVHKLQVTVGGTDCPLISGGKNKDASNKANATHLACVVPKGIGRGRGVLVISNTGAESQPQPYTYERPRITAVLPLPGDTNKDTAIANTVNGRRITVEGENLGPPGEPGSTPNAIKIVLSSILGNDNDSEQGGEECTDIRWEGLSSVSCVPTPGFGKRALVLVVAGQYSTVGHMTYIAPQVLGVSPPMADPGDTISVKIAGKNFGPRDMAFPPSALKVSIGKQACVGVALHRAEKLGEHDTITCNITVRPGGNKRVKVMVGGLESPKEGSPRFSATLPVVDVVTPNTCRLPGGCPLMVTGSRFFPGLTTQVLIGQRECTNVKVVSATTIHCIAPKGESGPQRVRVDVEGAMSLERTGAPLFKYPAASVTSVRPTHGSRTGGSVVTITGAGFGVTVPPKGALTALIGGVPCQDTVWESDTKLKCTVPAEGVPKPGEDASCMSVRVRVGPGKEQISKRNSKWRYEHQVSKDQTHSVELTPANVDQVVTGDRPVMIKLCSPNCEQCRKLQHPWNEVARLLKCKQVLVATVRGDRYPTLLERFGVQDYPRIVWIPEGLTTPSKEYTGVLSAERIIGWVARQFGHANRFWSPLESGDAGAEWGVNSATNETSPLLVGTGPLPPSQERCKAVPEAGAAGNSAETKLDEAPLQDLKLPPMKEAEEKRRRFFFF
jgi:hypothetical protein